MSLSDKLKGINTSGAQTKRTRMGPLWKGPEEDGITFSLLSRFLVCRERFRLLVVEGLKPADGFNHRLEYGNMWHVCEEAAASEVSHFEGELRGTDTTLWEDNLREYAESLCRRYPLTQEQINHWYNVCRIQFPTYVDYWSNHPDVVNRTPLLQEQVFDVPYRLPSGRTVKLRGKWDSVDLIGKGKGAGVYLQENKTKGDIVEEQLRRQLTFDLQTMMYLVALELADELKDGPTLTKAGKPLVSGVRYNVVRRPLSGGRGTIKQCKGESLEDYYARLRGIIQGEPEHYFMRWKVEIGPADVARFRRECLDPILESLIAWWDWVTSEEVAKRGLWYDGSGWGVHWRHPFGVYNPLDEGRSSDLDEYLHSGSTAGLQRTENLFPELTG